MPKLPFFYPSTPTITLCHVCSWEPSWVMSRSAQTPQCVDPPTPRAWCNYWITPFWICRDYLVPFATTQHMSSASTSEVVMCLTCILNLFLHQGILSSSEFFWCSSTHQLLLAIEPQYQKNNFGLNKIML